MHIRLLNGLKKNWIDRNEKNEIVQREHRTSIRIHNTISEREQQDGQNPLFRLSSNRIFNEIHLFKNPTQSELFQELNKT